MFQSMRGIRSPQLSKNKIEPFLTRNRQDMITYETEKHNVDRILDLTPEEQERKKEQMPQR